MEGVEEFKADGATVRVMHDPQDNTAGLCVVRPRFGDVRIWLQPEQTAELIRALQRMHARQVVEGAAPMLEGLAADDKRSK